MNLKFVDPPSAPPPLSAEYRNLAIVPADRRLLVIAGQIGNLMDGSIVEGLEAQYEQALANINAIVASEGGNSADIARITIFLAETPTEIERIMEANKKIFPGGPPAITWIYVAGLFLPEIKVEIEAIAAVA
jgi:enamine deaminase RidA (YjgF/YER057c/UK114 family)